MSGSGLFSREEVLAGMPARRARTLVYLIERAAARQRADREVRTMSLLGERSAEARELSWIEAFALDEEPVRQVTVQEIEAATGRWAPLVPRSADVRAATARLLAERHRLDRRRVTGIRTALGLDSAEVAGAFERQTGRPLASIWSPAGPVDGLRWLASAPGRWLEQASAFRAAAALTFLTSLGQSVLVVPVAVAAVGPITALASILVIGLLAVSATAAVAEATTRNGEVRFRGGFFGRLVTSTLGAGAGTFPTLLGITGIVLQTLAAFIGLGLLLAVTTPIPGPVWVAVLGAIAVAIPLRLRRTASFGGLLGFGLVNASMLALLSVLVLGSAAVGGDLSAPSLTPPGGVSLEVTLGLVVGVLLTTYADPVYTVQIGRVVLPRDPGGVGYLRGAVVGMAAFVAVTVVFSAVLLLVVPAGELAGENGSVLDALSVRFGAPVVVLATLIGLGLFGIRLYATAIALFDFVAEQLPGPSPRRVVLRAQGAGVLLSRRGADEPAASLTYRGMRDGRPLIDLVADSRGGAESRRLPAPGESTVIPVDGEALGIEVLAAGDVVLRLAIATDLAISYAGDPEAVGPGVAQSLLGGDETSRLSAWLLREGGGSAREAAQRFGWSPDEAGRRLAELVEGGAATVAEDGRFGPRMAARRRRSGLADDVWARLGAEPPADTSGDPEGEAAPRIGARLLASRPGRMVLGSLPTASLAALAAALIALGSASVSGPFRIGGVIAFATASCLLPPMLLLAARRRAQVAGAGGGGALTGPVLMAVSALFALATLILHATILWTDPFERGAAAVAAAIAFATVVFAIRHGAFRPAALVELRQSGPDGPVRILAEENGRPLPTAASLGGSELGAGYELGLEQLSEGLTIRGRSAEAEALRVSALRLEPAGAASPLPLTATLDGAGRPGSGKGEEPAPVRLAERGGTASFPAEGDWTLVLRAEASEP
jgi:hypothetical protein